MLLQRWMATNGHTFHWPLCLRPVFFTRCEGPGVPILSFFLQTQHCSEAARLGEVIFFAVFDFRSSNRWFRVMWSRDSNETSRGCTGCLFCFASLGVQLLYFSAPLPIWRTPMEVVATPACVIVWSQSVCVAVSSN